MKALVTLVMLLLWSPSLLAASNKCQSQSHRAFDFWLGEWQVTTQADNIIRHSKISLINDGCTLLEEYQTPSGYSGKSLNIYDKQSGKWHQTWTDNSGLLLLLNGEKQGNKMILTGNLMQNGQQVEQRITWSDNPDGTVRQHWQSRKSESKNWQTLFDGIYKKAR